MSTVNNETLAKEFFSKSVLSGIQDKGLMNTIRQIIFADSTKIDWQQALQIASKNMPELSQEIKESCECNEDDILTEDDLIDVSDEDSDSTKIEIPDVNDIGSTTRFDREKDLNDEDDEEIFNEEYDDDYDEDYDEDEEAYDLIDKKSVMDFDGSYVNYSWYERLSDNMYVFILGDGSPEDTEYDFETSSYDAAQEWFDDYLIVEDEDDILTEELNLK